MSGNVDLNAAGLVLTDKLKNERVDESAPATKKRNGKRRVNYAQLHRDALPLEVYPLPAFHPTNPLSLLQLIWTYVQQLAFPPRSRPVERYIGHYSHLTRSVHITDPKHIRALWERGFFGKGTLSRSEPSWMDRERARLVARSQGGQTAEEATKSRREERRLFKLERARLERERIENQRLVEQGFIAPTTPPMSSQQDNSTETTVLLPSKTSLEEVRAERTTLDDEDLLNEDLHITNQEHLQLTLEEAFFLSFGLGVIDIRLPPAVETSIDPSELELFNLFRSATDFGIGNAISGMDDQFILNYVVYHHFRSLGWVVRPGVKFSVDYLLYNRGPVFSHAEFAILIMPSYSHQYWSTAQGRSQRRLAEQRDWWWLHCINRVQSQVKKTLVLCYVDIPPPMKDVEPSTVKAFLSRYKAREFVLRRWLMNRMRD